MAAKFTEAEIQFLLMRQLTERGWLVSADRSRMLPDGRHIRYDIGIHDPGDTLPWPKSRPILLVEVKKSVRQRVLTERRGRGRKTVYRRATIYRDGYTDRAPQLDPEQAHKYDLFGLPWMYCMGVPGIESVLRRVGFPSTLAHHESPL